MDAQNYKTLSPKSLDFRKVLKIHEKNCKSAKKIITVFSKRKYWKNKQQLKVKDGHEVPWKPSL